VCFTLLLRIISTRGILVDGFLVAFWAVWDSFLRLAGGVGVVNALCCEIDSVEIKVSIRWENKQNKRLQLRGHGIVANFLLGNMINFQF
jgi:hypothetical protein